METISALRSKIMGSVKQKNTNLELIVRKILYNQGFRYRLHVKKLPGTPDIVLTRLKKIIFVHGCFWHGHDCKKGKLPKTNREFWSNKIQKNQLRDSSVIEKLQNEGWRLLILWQCDLVDIDKVTTILKDFLSQH